MSKMSQLHAELSEQANELGYGTLEEACQDGYHAEFNTNPLTHEESATLVPDLAKEQEKAHEAWLEEKEDILEMLNNMEKDIVDSIAENDGHPRYWVNTLERIRAFIEKGEV